MSNTVIQLADIKPGMVGLSGGGTFIQKAIKYFTGSQWSHSFTVMLNENGVLSALETTSTQVHLDPMINKMSEPDYVQIWEVIAPEEDLHRANELVRKQFLGMWYGYLSYLWFMYRWLLRKMGKEPMTMWGWVSGGVTCTELTCTGIYYISEIFKGLFVGRDINTQAPQELEAIMINNPALFRFVGWLKLP
jgi:hypothetical protein